MLCFAVLYFCQLSCRGLYMCLALLFVASRIILPIIWNEGLRAVFFPRLAPKPLENIKKVESLRSMNSLKAAANGLSKVHSS